MDRVAKFWKSIGGYRYAVLQNGQWRYVGGGQTAIDYMRRWFKEQKAAGRTLRRVDFPQPLVRAIARHGHTAAAYGTLPRAVGAEEIPL